MLVNALAHLVTSARLRKYNPGLVTSVALFLPLSAATIWTVGGLVPQLIDAALAILLHITIFAVVAARHRSFVVTSLHRRRSHHCDAEKADKARLGRKFTSIGLGGASGSKSARTFQNRQQAPKPDRVLTS
jgi:uncharacterized membrane protein YbhN (UPF0104 family)